MGWITRTFQSSIGKKTIMAATGFLLGFFLIVHVIGNMTALAGRQTFIDYSESLHSMGYLIPIFETGLLLAFITHITTAVILYFENLRARPSRYAVNSNAGDRTWGSRTMPYTGLFILCFLVVHLYNFHFSTKKLLIADLVRETLRQPPYTAFYVIAVLGLTLHVSHGFWSLFQTFGLNHPKYDRIIDAWSLVLSAVVCTVFIMIPLLALFFDQFLL